MIAATRNGRDRETVTTHVSSPAEIIGIFIVLLILTAMTVQASLWSAGGFDVWIALGIAGIKATLVAGWYMHLRHDRGTNTLLLIFSIMVVVLFLGLTLSDTRQLVPEVDAAAEDASRSL